jgi:signal transduction histidine kinase
MREEVDLQAGQIPEVERRRFVLSADADRRAIERELHGGVHQHLVALAVSLQLLERAVDSDPGAAKPLLEEMKRDVRQALDETARLAQRIYPSTLELGGLGVLLRSAAVSAGVPATVEVVADSSYPPEVVMTVYLWWLALLARSDEATIRVREAEDALTFELVGTAPGDGDLEALQDRVDALGGRLTIAAEAGGAVRATGSMPLRR